MQRIEQLKEYLKQNPADSFLQHALALEFVKTGDDPTARKLFEKLLELEPSYVGSYYHLARLCERSHDKEAAIKWYEKGMEEAKKAGELRTFNELKAAYEELLF
jgi:Tfp pilus assembly protein PilF